MTTKVKKIKASLGLQRTSDADLLKQLNTVHDGMNGNSAFSSPPVDMPIFKKGIDTFTVLVTDAEDGGKKAIAAKNKQREVMIKMVTQLGHYVEAACNDDLATFKTSGFVAVSSTRTPPQPLRPGGGQSQNHRESHRLRCALRSPWHRRDAWYMDESHAHRAEENHVQ